MSDFTHGLRTRAVTLVTLAAFSASALPMAAWANPSTSQNGEQSSKAAVKVYTAIYSTYQKHSKLSLARLKEELLKDAEAKLKEIESEPSLSPETREAMIKQIHLAMSFFTQAKSTTSILNAEARILERFYQDYHLAEIASAKLPKVTYRQIAYQGQEKVDNWFERNATTDKDSELWKPVGFLILMTPFLSLAAVVTLIAMPFTGQWREL